MTVTLEDIERRLQTLEDINAIKELKARYLRACDRQKPDDVRECLLPTGAIIAYDGFPEFNDREPFVEIFAQMGCQPGIYDMHHATNAEITITGPDTATGKWALYFNNINVAQRTVMQMGLEYTDDYQRRDGRWWISATRTKRTSFFMESIAEDGTPTVLALGESAAAFGEMETA